MPRIARVDSMHMRFRCPGCDDWHMVHAVCHSFVRAGRIEFLHDSTHHLACQSVDLPEIP